jgi:hypothetical protein
VWVTTPAELYELVNAFDVEEVSLDHDLGLWVDGREIDGYSVIRRWEERLVVEGWLPPIIGIHTQNSAARVRMERGVEAIERRMAALGLERPPARSPADADELPEPDQLGVLRVPRPSLPVTFRDTGGEIAPLICASEMGFCPLGDELRFGRWSPAVQGLVGRIADAMRYSESGLLLALLDLEDAPRRLALVQDNRGPFYERRYGGDHAQAKGWKDFYYSAGYYLAERIDDLWAAPEVELAHPTGWRWHPNVAPPFLEGLRARHISRPLALERVRVNGCCDGPAAIAAALAIVNREPLADHRNLHVIEMEFSEIGISISEPGVHLMRVELPPLPSEAAAA